MIKGNDTRNSASISNAIFNSYYPQGRMLIHNTSFSKEGVSGRTLTSRTISDVVQGDALYRSPKYSLSYFNKSIGSSINSLITSGGETVFSNSASVTIQDPDNIDQTVTVSGGQAYAKILSTSILGQQGMSSFTDEAVNKLFSSQLSINESIDINGYDHTMMDDSPVNGAAPSAGSRAITFESDMSEEEKGWYLERAKILKDHEPQLIGDRSFLYGYTFDIPNTYSDLRYSDGDSKFPNLPAGTNTKIVDPSIIAAEPKKAFICPAMIECMIALSKKITFRADFAPTRGLDHAIGSDNTASNHIFGRAADIPFVGDLKNNISNMWDNVGNAQIYKKAFDLLMGALNTIPQHIQPDLLVVSDQIADEYGIIKGNEEESAEVYKKYPNCKYIKLHPATDHRNHIHLSFSAARAGIYTGPGGSFTVNPIDATAISVSTQGTSIYDSTTRMSSVIVPSATTSAKFKQSFKTPNSGALTANEIYQLLVSTIAYPELAAVLTAISQREGNTGSMNPGAVKSGDYSIGFLQMNFLVYGKYNFVLPTSNGQKFEGWKLALLDWQRMGITDFNSWKNWVKEKDRNSPEGDAYRAWIQESKAISDDRLWMPINQVYIYYKCMTARDPSYPISPDQKLGAVPQMQHVLSPWGDYGGGPVAGPIYKTKFSDAAAVYRQSGKKEEDLKNWIRAYFANPNNGATSRSVPYIDGWLNGKVYARDGSEVTQ